MLVRPMTLPNCSACVPRACMGGCRHSCGCPSGCLGPPTHPITRPLPANPTSLLPVDGLVAAAYALIPSSHSTHPPILPPTHPDPPRSLLPVDGLVASVEKRNRLKLLTPFLEHLIREGSTDPHVVSFLGVGKV